MPSENGLKWQTFHDTKLHESQKDLLSIGARCGVKMLFQSYNKPCRWLHLKQWILNYIDIRPSPHFKNLTCKMRLSAKLFLWKSLSRQNPCDCLRFKTGALFKYFIFVYSVLRRQGPFQSLFTCSQYGKLQEFFKSILIV